MTEDTQQTERPKAKAPVVITVFAVLAFLFGGLKLLGSLPILRQAPLWYSAWTIGGILFMWVVAVGLLLMKRWSIVVYFIGFALNWIVTFAMYPVDQALHLNLAPGLTVAYLAGVLLPPVLVTTVAAVFWKRMK